MKWLLTVVFCLLLVPDWLYSQTSNHAWITMKAGGKGLIYQQSRLQLNETYNFKKNETIMFEVALKGEIFGNAYSNHMPFIIFPGDSLTIEHIGTDFKVTALNDPVRTNDFLFLNALTQKLGTINNVDAFEEKLPLVDVNNTWKGKDIRYFKEFKQHLPRPPKSNAERDSLLFDQYQKRLRFFNDYSRRIPLTGMFQTFYKNFILYKYISSSLNGLVLTNEYHVLPDKLSGYINHYDAYIADTLLNVSVYRHFLVVLNTYLTLKNYGKEDIAYRLKSAASLFPDEAKNYIGYAVFYNYLRRSDSPDSSIYRYYKDTFSGPEYISVIDETYAQKKGRGLIDPALELTNGKDTFDFNTLVRSEKFDLFYIDFWASWCIPCLEEMPASQKLQQEFEGKRIGFLYVSLDQTPRIWKNFSKNRKNLDDPLKSYYLINGFKSGLAKKLNIKALPKYALVNKNGQIIIDDAPRPGDPKVKELFDKHLKNKPF